MKPLEELAVGVHEFLLATPERFKLHPVLHLGYSSLGDDSSGNPESDSGWISVLRPAHYVELYVRESPKSGAEVEMHVMRWKGFDKQVRGGAFDYGIGGIICKCEYCSDRYRSPYADTNIDEEFFFDLSCPDSLGNIRKNVLLRRW